MLFNFKLYVFLILLYWIFLKFLLFDVLFLRCLIFVLLKVVIGFLWMGEVLLLLDIYLCVFNFILLEVIFVFELLRKEFFLFVGVIFKLFLFWSFVMEGGMLFLFDLFGFCNMLLFFLFELFCIIFFFNNLINEWILLIICFFFFLRYFKLNV